MAQETTYSGVHTWSMSAKQYGYDPDSLPGTSSNHSQNSDSNTGDRDKDSGYGSVIREDDEIELEPGAYAINGELTSSVKHQRSPSELSKQRAISQIHQLQYNDNRNALSRSIATVLRMLKELQEMNRKTPVYYPPAVSAVLEKGKSKGKEPRHNGKVDRSILDDEPLVEPLAPQQLAEPRLLLARNGHEFNVFKLDLKLGGLSSEDLLNSMEQASVASLLENKIIQTMKHLAALRERLDDTASKVLITGDLNSGKSTFCNALLRRNLLPTDQQPLTNVFCEVRDARENDGAEEVHAVPIGEEYEIGNRSTYKIYDLKELEHLVLEYEKYSILKVYVNDNRPPTHSLLNNGVVDISLIDAPGLNKDSYQTTQLFSRQEEIDLVVFVVSAENHFTLSAKEFIHNAAHEKSFIFIVVNRFDNIRDKSRCMKRILDQVADLSPETHKDARDFVHFISSGEVVDSFPDDGDDPDGDGGDGDSIDFQDPDFDRLEASLRDFVLEKRSISKLAPAKTYLTNILQDLESLAEVNIRFANVEKDKYLKRLSDLTPQYEKLMTENTKVSETIEQDIENLATNVYDYTTEKLTLSLTPASEKLPKITYNSFVDLYRFAVSTRQAIIENIQQEVYACEHYSRTQTTAGVNSIKSIGILHLGDQPVFQKLFRGDVMFSRKRDHLSRSINAGLSITDFFDVHLPMWIPASTSNNDKSLTLSTVNNALTLVSVVGGGQLIRNSKVIKTVIDAVGLINQDTFKKLVVPAIVVATAFGIYYVITDIPRAVPKNISKKVMKEVESMGYVHANAERISKECRKVLRYPARDVQAGFQSNIETQARKKDEFAKSAKAAEVGFQYFTRLQRDAAEQRELVSRCNLEVSVELS